MEDYQRKMQKACNSCQAPHSLIQQLITFFLYAWFEKKKKIGKCQEGTKLFFVGNTFNKLASNAGEHT